MKKINASILEDSTQYFIGGDEIVYLTNTNTEVVGLGFAALEVAGLSYPKCDSDNVQADTLFPEERRFINCDYANISEFGAYMGNSVVHDGRKWVCLRELFYFNKTHDEQTKAMAYRDVMLCTKMFLAMAKKLGGRVCTSEAPAIVFESEDGFAVEGEYMSMLLVPFDVIIANFADYSEWKGYLSMLGDEVTKGVK